MSPPPIKEGIINEIFNTKYTKLEFILLIIILVLSGTLLAFDYLAQKDMTSLRSALHECKQKIAYINDGKMPMMNFNISQVENAIIEEPTE